MRVLVTFAEPLIGDIGAHPSRIRVGLARSDEVLKLLAAACELGRILTLAARAISG